MGLVRHPRQRRALLLGTASALGSAVVSACAVGSPGSASTSGPHRLATAVQAGFVPTSDTPRTDGRLTLIWFFEPE